MAKTTEIDWLEVERAYREGVRALRDIAGDAGCTEGAIRKRAKAEGWVRNEGAVYRDAAQAEANQRLLSKRQDVIATNATPKVIADIAEIAGGIIASHRRGAATLRQALTGMAEELVSANAEMPELEERLEEYYLAKAAGNPLMAGIYRAQMYRALAAVSLGGRSKTILNMANTLEKLANIERRAWNLDEDGDKTRSYEEVLNEVYQNRLNKRTEQKRLQAA